MHKLMAQLWAQKLQAKRRLIIVETGELTEDSVWEDWGTLGKLRQSPPWDPQESYGPIDVSPCLQGDCA